MIDLAIAQETGRPMLRLVEIIEKENIPTAFMEQIFMQLREAGYIDAKRGKYGGYFLAKPADTITIGQIIRLIDGPLAPIGCVSQTSYEKCSCPNEEHCALRMLMLDVRNSIAGILDSYTLKQSVDVAIQKLQRDGLPIPFSPSPLTDPQTLSLDFQI